MVILICKQIGSRNDGMLPDGHDKEEGFWHAVSRKDRDSGERLPAYRRAEHLPWARPTNAILDYCLLR